MYCINDLTLLGARCSTCSIAYVGVTLERRPEHRGGLGALVLLGKLKRGPALIVLRRPVRPSLDQQLRAAPPAGRAGAPERRCEHRGGLGELVVLGKLKRGLALCVSRGRVRPSLE